MINYADLKKIMIEGAKHKDKRSVHEDAVTIFEEKLEGKGESKQWFYKTVVKEQEDPVVEAVAQNLFRLFDPNHPEYKVVHDEKGNALGVLSQKVEGNHVTDPAQFDKKTEGILSSTRRCEDYLLAQNRFRNLGVIQILCFFVGETDLRWHNLFYNDKAGFIKIDGDRCFSRYRNNAAFSGKITADHLYHLPYMIQPASKKRLTTFNPFNWLGQVQGGAYHLSNPYFNILQRDTPSVAFRQEIHETLLKIFLLPSGFLENFIRQYTSDQNQIRALHAELIYQKRLLLFAALQNKNFLEHFDQHGLDIANTFIKSNSAFDPSLMHFELRKLRYFRQEIAENPHLTAILKLETESAVVDFDYPLHSAIYNSKSIAELKEAILEQKMDVDQKDPGGNTPLMCAAIHGNIPMIRMLLEAKADPNITNNEQDTALSLAMAFNQIEVIKFLMASDKIKQDENSIIEYFSIAATKESNLQAATFLYESMTKKQQDTLIQNTLSTYNVSSFKMLEKILHQKMTFNDTDLLQNAVALEAKGEALNQSRIDFVVYLLQKNIPHTDKISALNTAAKSGQLDLFKKISETLIGKQLVKNEDKNSIIYQALMLAYKNNPPAFNIIRHIFETFPSSLFFIPKEHFAGLFQEIIRKNDAPMMSALFKSVTDGVIFIDQAYTDKIDGATPLMHLIDKNEQKLFESFTLTLRRSDQFTAKTNAMIFETTPDGDTLMTYAIQKQKYPAFRGLIHIANNFAHQEILLQPNASGNTPLLLLSESGKTDEISLLLSVFKHRKFNLEKIYQPNLDGQTPLMLAAQNGHTEVVNRLIQTLRELEYASHPIPKKFINPVNADGQTPLMLAAQNGHLDVVKALLSAMDPKLRISAINTLNKDGKSALMLAVQYKHVGVAELLFSQLSKAPANMEKITQLIDQQASHKDKKHEGRDHKQDMQRVVTEWKEAHLPKASAGGFFSKKTTQAATKKEEKAMAQPTTTVLKK